MTTTFLAARAIQERVRQVLLLGDGSVRTVTSDRFAGRFPTGLSDTATLYLASATPRVEPRVQFLGASKASPHINGNVLLRDVLVTVRCVRLITTEHQLNDQSRDALLALGCEDCDAIAQSLTWPGNMQGTRPVVYGSGGTFPTGFAGGETLTVSVDGSADIVTFQAGDQSAAQVADRMNLDLGAAATFVASNELVGSYGQLLLVGLSTGTGKSIEITPGTVATTLGLSGSSAGADTTLLSSLLRLKSASQDIRRSVDDGAQVLESIVELTGVARTTPAIS